MIWLARIWPLLLCLLPTVAQAGPWPREKGTVFLSFSHSIDDNGGKYTALYAEYGMRHKLTFGLDAGKSETEWTAIAFLRRPIGPEGWTNRFAIELGAGAIHDGMDPVVRPGVSWGRGINTRWGGGWLTIEASGTYAPVSKEESYKMDATFGVSRPNDVKWILQLQGGGAKGEEGFLRLAPSFVRKYGPRHHLEITLSTPLDGDGAQKLKLGTWIEF